MATKIKSKAKAAKKVSRRRVPNAKSLGLSRKATKKSVSPSRAKASVRESSRASVAAPSTSPPTTTRVHSKQFLSAVHAYEAGLKAMHAEHFEKAKKILENLIAGYPDEPEIQDRAKILVSACEKKIHEKARTVVRSADDHYNIGIAFLNRRELDSARQHLQQALKLAPKSDHILYALAAASALKDDREQALSYLKQSIQYRPANRFLAIRDSDFERLHQDADFKQLVTASEK
ncbi:MAG: hypothetical protein DMG13_05190 [Acidobacteria bacterium]|nr:MAG: hypothetical protein DMG13_05190 [Acidobacteriota bacterium]